MVVPDYNYTKPRGLIGAMTSSPGPAAYNVPTLVGRPCHDPRSVHHKYPAFSIGGKLKTYTKDCSPGPIYLPADKILRDGPDGAPKFSLGVRLSTSLKNRSPGPAKYYPGKNSGLPSPPEFTFGVKGPLTVGFQTPGPNIYTLPPMIGETVESMRSSAPSFSVTSRNYPPESRTKVPGPGTYKIVRAGVYMLDSPQFSMTASNPPPGDRSLRPGPMSYYPERVTCNRSQLPSPSFGIKHSLYCGTLMVKPAGDDIPLCP